MKINKTKFNSYCLNGFADGCKYCVKGEKLVLFVSGICKRGCWYCSLSEKRKNEKSIFANEKKCKNLKEIIEEARNSNATSVGVTGGDPILCLNKTIKLVSGLKKEFGNNFHSHIYLTTQFVTKDKLLKLKKCIDEVRFHPSFLVKENEKEEDIKKIRYAKSIFGIENVGLEMPMIPEKKEEILDFILRVKDDISFVNLNEFELSETNFNIVTKKYKLKEGGYIIKNSLGAGIFTLNKLKNYKLKVHLCTASLKNNHQFVNRLKRYKILPYGKRTKDGTVVYLSINEKLKLNGTFYDKEKKRTILSEPVARKFLNKKRIIRTEEFPTSDRLIIEEEVI